MNTQNLNDFGYREIGIAGKLLTEYSNNPQILDGDGVKVEFNPNNGNVFLVDEDCNVAMLNDRPAGDTLEQFFTCPYCGHEGFLEDMEHEPQDEECINYMEQIGV